MYYGFVAAASSGLDAEYPELDLDSNLSSVGKALFDAADTKNGCLLDLLGTDYAYHSTKDF